MRKKKVGIVTILKVNNYGAELQAYATQEFLKSMGYEAEIIDYLFYKNPQHKRTRLSKPLFAFPLKKRVAEFVYPLLSDLRNISNGKTLARRKNRFENFHRLNTSMSPTYRSIDELYDAEMDYDVYLTGSDQVWNPGIYTSIAPYFLDFAPKGCRRVAYASSFGVSQIPTDIIPCYNKYLSSYDAIGVREKNGVDLVKDISGKNAQWVLDPTLLLSKDEWQKVALPIDVPKEYILIYELTPCGYIKQLAEHIGKEKHLNIVRVCKNANKEDKDGILNITDAGPAEFLYLFANASMVITNSFHGTAFSINFQRPFYTVLPKRKQNNSRQRSLLELFDMTDRLLVEDAPYPNMENWKLDYSRSNVLLEQERVKSTQFLKKAIDGE